MIICICRRVSDRDIARAAGVCADFDELQDATGAGTACGACLDCARACFAAHATTQAMPVTAVPPRPAPLPTGA